MTPEKKSVFLETLRDGNSVATAAKRIGVSRKTVYEWRKADDEFRAEWETALEEGTDGLEDVAIKRAKEGSDTLLIFMLKARRREVYADLVKQWHSGPNDKPIQTQAIEDTRVPIGELLQAALADGEVAATKH